MADQWLFPRASSHSTRPGVGGFGGSEAGHLRPSSIHRVNRTLLSGDQLHGRSSYTYIGYTPCLPRTTIPRLLAENGSYIPFCSFVGLGRIAWLVFHLRASWLQASGY